MRRGVPPALVLALALLGAGAALGQPAGGVTSPTVEVSTRPLMAAFGKVKKEALTVGDRIEVTLTVRVHESDLTGPPRFPVWQKSWGEAEILFADKPGKLRGTGGPLGVAVWEQRLIVTAFRPGRIPLPPVEVALPYPEQTVQARTPADLALNLKSVLPAGEKDPKLKAAAPPRRLPLGAPFWWMVAALTSACLLLGWLLFRRRAEPAAAVAPEPALPPFEELLAELNRISREPSPVFVHTRISQALRHYLGRSLAIPATESTTSEVQRRLLSRRLPAGLVRRTVELLRACDMVKFARQEATPERVQERIETARDIAREMEMQNRPVMSGEPAGPAPPSPPLPLRKVAG
jgi:hypothetical protein